MLTDVSTTDAVASDSKALLTLSVTLPTTVKNSIPTIVDNPVRAKLCIGVVAGEDIYSPVLCGSLLIVHVSIDVSILL